MRVLRGRAADHESDHERTCQLTAAVADSRVPALRVWRPHRQVAFGRRDAREDGYERARGIARERGYAVLERSVGGRAVAYTGTTVAVALAVPTDGDRSGIQRRYDDASARLQSALDVLGVDASEGEPPDSFCPGSHSLQAGGKIAGIAQRVRQRVAVVAAVLVVDDRDEIATLLDPVYSALGVPFDPESVGSIALAGGPADPDAVIEALVATFVGDRSTAVEHASDETELRDT
ncbi:lipoyl protein ligase domain-containing protein [Halomicrobium katesii]|uniref:lipoyl protein ligase domain-containing protein n=1 Tax=Halomicrobium katesii TaxID=437163 RepID=UPI0003620385|nr:lipoate--protein ligase family protein [Halomicrobium katesii]